MISEVMVQIPAFRTLAAFKIVAPFPAWEECARSPLIMATQLIVGTLLLANRFVPPALVVLAPFIFNSIAFQILRGPSGRPMPFIVLVCELYLVWTYPAAFRPMLVAR